MTVTLVDALSRKPVGLFGAPGALLPAPCTGDTLVLTNGKQYAVLQRAYVCQQLNTGNIVSIGGEVQLDFDICCYVAPMEHLDEYLEKAGIRNAGT